MKLSRMSSRNAVNRETGRYFKFAKSNMSRPTKYETNNIIVFVLVGFIFAPHDLHLLMKHPAANKAYTNGNLRGLLHAGQVFFMKA